MTSLCFAKPLVSETVGRAGDYVITSREVKISTFLEKALFLAKPEAISDLQAENLLKDEALLQGAITSVLLEVVVALEAESFAVSAVPEKDIQDAVLKAQVLFAGKAYWVQLEVSDAELVSCIKRKFTAKSFLKFKTSSMNSIITDQEAEAYYEKNKMKFGAVPFSSFKDNIKSFLGQQQLEDRLRSWFEVIKRKHKVRNLISGWRPYENRNIKSTALGVYARNCFRNC